MSTQQVNFNKVIGSICLPSLEDLSMFSVIKYILEMKQEEVTETLCKHFAGKWLSSCLPTNQISEISSKFKSIRIPEVIEAKFFSLIHWVVDQYNDWIYYVMKEIKLEDKFLNRKKYVEHIMEAVRWNVNGTINYQQSLCAFLSHTHRRDDDHIVMFNLASQYCLEDDMTFLWQNLLSADKNNLCKMEEDNLIYCLKLYWVCKMTGDDRKFLNFAHEYMKRKGGRHSEALDLEMNYLENAENCGFVLAILEGCPSAIQYFSSNLIYVDQDFLVYLAGIYLRRIGCKDKYRNVEINVLYMLLNHIQDDELTRRIFNDYFMIFLRLSVKFWLCHKYLGDLVKMSSDGIDHILFYELMTMLLFDLQEGKTYELFLVRSVWRNISNSVKKLFCLFILNSEQKKLDMINLWVYVTIDIINMFLIDEEFKKVSDPYGNNGIVELLLARKYEVVDYWLKKCLISEAAIVSFMNHFVITKSVDVFKKFEYSKGCVIEYNQFIDWAFKYEDGMNKEEVFRVKDEALQHMCDYVFQRGIALQEWEDLDKFINWMLKNRDNYEDELISFKKEALRGIADCLPWRNIYFANFLSRFLHYGVNNTEKIEVMISEKTFNKMEICMDLLQQKNWSCIDSFLKFLSKYGVSIQDIKQNILRSILNGRCERDFQEHNLCKNLEKLLYWNSQTESDIKKKVWEIKKLELKERAHVNIAWCIAKEWWSAFNNLLNFLCKEGIEDESFAKIIFDFKKAVIEERMRFFPKTWWLTEYFTNLINLGITNENVKKEIWITKKMAFELFKNDVDNGTILDIILGKNKGFISSIFIGYENENDFEEFLWNLKEFLIKKIVTDDNCSMLLELFERFGRLEKFLHGNGFSETGFNNLKKFIIDNKAIHLSLHWISKVNLEQISRILDWHDNIFDFKCSVLNELVKDSNFRFIWRSLKYFLDYKFNLNVKEDKKKYSELKNYIFKSCGVDMCYNWILKDQYSYASTFLEWCFEPVQNKKLIKFKNNLIKKHGPEFCKSRIFHNDWEKLKHFLEWCFESHEENIATERVVIDLKIKTLKQKDNNYLNYKNVILPFLKWGFTSEDRVRYFKLNILDRNHPLHYFTERNFRSLLQF